ncbi:MAG: response regulator, partial [Endozoicomonas sp.]
MNVLIVDDEPLARERLRQLISRIDNFMALEHEASNGRDAIDLCVQLQPDIVLMDIRMPRMDGIATIKAIRADPGLKSAAVIALSAGVLASEIEEAMNAGFDDYLTKPLIADAIYKVLAGIVGIALETKTVS